VLIAYPKCAQPEALLAQQPPAEPFADGSAAAGCPVAGSRLLSSPLKSCRSSCSSRQCRRASCEYATSPSPLRGASPLRIGSPGLTDRISALTLLMTSCDIVCFGKTRRDPWRAQNLAARRSLPTFKKKVTESHLPRIGVVMPFALRPHDPNRPAVLANELLSEPVVLTVRGAESNACACNYARLDAARMRTRKVSTSRLVLRCHTACEAVGLRPQRAER